MKKIRTIGIMAIVAISLLLCTGVVKVWNDTGCSVESLITGCVWHVSCTCALGAVVLERIERKFSKH